MLFYQCTNKWRSGYKCLSMVLCSQYFHTWGVSNTTLTQSWLAYIPVQGNLLAQVCHGLRNTCTVNSTALKENNFKTARTAPMLAHFLPIPSREALDPTQYTLWSTLLNTYLVLAESHCPRCCLPQLCSYP